MKKGDFSELPYEKPTYREFVLSETLYQPLKDINVYIGKQRNAGVHIFPETAQYLFKHLYIYVYIFSALQICFNFIHLYLQ